MIKRATPEPLVTKDDADTRITHLRAKMFSLDTKRHWSIWAFLAGAVLNFSSFIGLIAYDMHMEDRARTLMPTRMPSGKCCTVSPERRQWIQEKEALHKQIREPGYSVIVGANALTGGLSLAFMAFAFGAPFYRKRIDKKVGALYDLRDTLPVFAPTPPPPVIRVEDLQIKKATTLTVTKVSFRAGTSPR